MKPITHLRLIILLLFGSTFILSLSSLGAYFQSQDTTFTPYTSYFDTPSYFSSTSTYPSSYNPFLAYPGSSAANNLFSPQNTPIPDIILPSLNLEYATPLDTLPQGTKMRVLILGQTGSGKSTFL